jgi:hypothetical protein
MKKKILPCLGIFATSVFVFGFLNFWSVLASRSPHHITSRLGVRVIADYWTTNPVVVQSHMDWQWSGTNREAVVIKITNYLWKRY